MLPYPPAVQIRKVFPHISFNLVAGNLNILRNAGFTSNVQISRHIKNKQKRNSKKGEHVALGNLSGYKMH